MTNIVATSPVVEFLVVPVEVVDNRTFSYNEYIHYRAEIGRPVNGDREQFHAYLPRFAQGHRWTLDCWWQWWDRFIQAQDARDLQETQQDALT